MILKVTSLYGSDDGDMIKASGEMIVKLFEAVQALEKRVTELECERRTNILANLHAASKEQG